MTSAKLFLYSFVTFFFILLNKFAVSQTLICAVRDHDDNVTKITCPSGLIVSDVRFASYGNPGGSCGSYTVGSCHASNSMNIISSECLNQTTCSLTSSHGVFDLSECHDETMQLYAEVLCSEYSISPTVHPLDEEMTVDKMTLNVKDESDIEDMNSYDCQSGWTYYYGKCYYFNIGTGYSWSGCKSQCTSLSASMLCITDSTTNSWIANKIYYNTAYYYSWIGYSDSSNTGYKWISGCSSSYTNWNYNSYYYSYDYAYMGASSGTWYATYDYGYSSIACSCQKQSGSSSSYDDDDNSSSSAVAIVIIVAIVVGCCICCCGPIIFGVYFFFILGRNSNRIVTVDSSSIDTSNNQEYRNNGNIAHAFQVTNSSQEYGHGNISPSFPVASGNKGFYVIGNNQEFPVFAGNQGIPLITSNQGIPLITSNQGIPFITSNQGIPFTGNQGIPITTSNQGIPVTSSNNQVYGNVTTF